MLEHNWNIWANGKYFWKRSDAVLVDASAKLYKLF